MVSHPYHLIADHCLDHELLSADQWGFRPGRSTVSALVCAVDDWLSELEGNGSVCCAFIDLQKAFDSVPHRALLDKLSSLGFDNFLLKWLCDYLTGRTQQVVVNGSTSFSLPVTSGVPQGSVLGPLLFLIYIDDVTKVELNSGSKLILYADDILLYRPIKHEQDFQLLQSDILSIEQWAKQWYLI